MATQQNALSRYRSISRPAPTSSGFSSYASSLVKKNNAAEDAIIDKQYEEGLISADTYKIQLQNRLTRTYLTPLQVVTLSEKVQAVDEALVDAKVDKGYASGEYSTDQVLQYNQAKLARITQQDSVAYQTQAKKVQQLVDKAEREKRSQFRVQENLRISEMPEDTSERLLEKANLFAKLEQQARLDGDNQTADTFATSKNNYLQSAKRADINDLITGARLTNSETPTQGLGVPSAENGLAILNGRTPSASAPFVSGSGSPGNTGSGGVGIGGVSTGFGGVSNKTLTNAYEALDRSQKSINRMYGEREDKVRMLQTYQQAIARATGDQKTQLIIAANGITDDIKRLDNSIEITSASVQDTIARVQEIQARAAASAFSQEVRKNDKLFNQAETDLETEFAKGKITKQEYIQKGVSLAQMKAQFYGQASDGFINFGNEGSADTYMTKATDMERISQSLGDVATNIDDYEQLQVDPGGKLTNLLGKSLKPGDFALTNVRKLRDAGSFNSNYVNVKGKYYRVYYPGQMTDNEGFPVSSSLNQDFAKLNNQAYIYLPKNGKIMKESINFVRRTDPETKEIIAQPFLKNDIAIDGKVVPGIQTFIKKGAYQVDPKTGAIIATPAPQTGLLDRALAAGDRTVQNVKTAIQQAGGMPSIPSEEYSPLGGSTKSKVYYPFKADLGFLKKPVENVKNFIGGTLNKISEFIAPPVYGDNGDQLTTARRPVVESKKIDTRLDEAKDLKGVPSDVVANITSALKEQGIYSPQTLAYALATIKHETAGTYRPVNEGFYVDEKGNLAPGTTGRAEALKRGYDGGEDYYGRGYIQLTGASNYQKYADALGVDLVNNPDLANDPTIAAKILALYFKDRGTADLVNQGKAVDARGTINADNKGNSIAKMASDILRNLGSVVNPKQVSAATRLPIPTVNGLTEDQYIKKVRSETNSKSSDTQLRSVYRTELARQESQKLQQDPILRSLGDSTPVNTASAGLRSATPTSSVKVSTPSAQKSSSPSLSLPKISVPQISLPKISLPTISVPKPIQNVVSNVQKAAAPVVNKVTSTVKNVVSSVSNVLKKLKFW